MYTVKTRMTGSKNHVTQTRVNRILQAHSQQIFIVGIDPVSVVLPALKTVTMLNKHQQRLQETQRTLKHVRL